MLAQVFRIRGSRFRLLPNPTNDRWQSGFGTGFFGSSTFRLMEAFQQELAQLHANYVDEITKTWRYILDLGEGSLSSLELIEDFEVLEALHDSADAQTEYLRSVPQAIVLSVLVTHISGVVKELNMSRSVLHSGIHELALMEFYFSKIRINVIPATCLVWSLGMLSDTEEQREEIWIRLIYRMLCWLLLHDFDSEDIQIVPSDLIDSDMPIFLV